MKEESCRKREWSYSAHLCDKSDTILTIRRHPAPTPTPATHTPLRENPYVFKPKSYSSRRAPKQLSYDELPPPQGHKKIKTNPPPELPTHSENHLDTAYIVQNLTEAYMADPQQSKGVNSQMEEEAPLTLPLRLEVSRQNRSNPQLSHRIEIVSTVNDKISVPIHESLLKANTSHSKQEKSLDGIVNPFDKALRESYSQKISFTKDYKSGYTPIEMQKRSQKEEDQQDQEETKKEKGGYSKSHFIKKKQSTLSLTRSCGVSYIKPSESVQGPPFEPLPPVIFQCSTSCPYTPQIKQLYDQHIDRLFSLASTRWLPAILTHEDNMRDLLLGKPCGRVIWVEGLVNLWTLLNEGAFILVLMDEEWPETEEQVWSQFNRCHFKFGILAKRSISGKKLFLKSIQMGDKDETMSLPSMESMPSKMESVVSQHNKEPNENKPEIEIEGDESSGKKSPSHDVTMNLEVNPSKVPALSKEVSMVQENKSSSEERLQCKTVEQQFMEELKNSRTVTTMALKFEMYVPEYFWKGISAEGRILLNATILSFEQSLQKKALEVIRDRLELASGERKSQVLADAMSKLRLGKQIDKFKEAPEYEHDSSKTYDLQRMKALTLALQNRRPLVPGEPMTVEEVQLDKQGRHNPSQWEKSLKMPIYYISTRDSFAFDLIEKETLLRRGSHFYKKIEYFFSPDNMPDNFREYRKFFPDLKVGLTAYHNFYTEEELQLFEGKMLATERSAFKNKFLHMTVQPTIVGNRIKRTKFFFGYRYMWTRCQLAEPMSYVGAGVRRDVTPAPKWLEQVESPMVEHSIVEKDFLNSYAINVYHDGSQGLAQHFDDAVRFKQPIFTLRLVSDGRLSFGSQFYGFCNGAFVVPLPRGCILSMEENSYAANGVKHCVRPCDMSGKSAAIIMRQMHHQVVKEAAKYDELVDFPAWLSTLSEDPSAITFAQQKRREAEQLLHHEQRKKEKLKETAKTKEDQTKQPHQKSEMKPMEGEVPKEQPKMELLA